MSDYDEPRTYRSTRKRPRGRDDAEYVEETTFVQKGKGPPPKDLVYRSRDDSVESIDRDFPPPGSRGNHRNRDSRSDYDAPRRSRSFAGDRRSYYSDDYDDYGAAGAGAAAGYAAGRGSRDYDRRRRNREGYYSDDDRSPRRRSRSRSRSGDRKSGIEGLIEGLGLGGLLGAAAGKHGDRARSKSRGRGGSRDRTDRQGRKWAQAAQAAAVAGAIEAFRARNEPGPWLGGVKAKRIATAAIGAGGIDRLVDRDPDTKSKRHIVEAVLGGLAANRLANGPRSKSKVDDDRGRSRSRSRSVLDRFRSRSRGVSGSRSPTREGGGNSTSNTLKGLAAGGGIAAAGKYIYDRVRSKSRGAENRRRSPSASSDDSYVPSRSRRGDRDRDVGSYSQSRALPPSGAGNPNSQAVGYGAAGAGAAAGAVIAHPGGQNGGTMRDGSEQISSTESDTSIERKRKKMRGKEYITAALATVATIHAAHGVYNSMEKSSQRHRLVQEGTITKEEARKQRAKARLQDAAAIGIAALGIKGAYSEWKEMTEHRHELKELEEKRRKRAKRREQQAAQAQQYGGYPPPAGYIQGPPPPQGYGPPARR